MKRILPITLAFIIVLNTMGYYAIFLGLHYRNDRAMSRALDSGAYDRSNTLTLKVPVSIPYMPDQTKFERVHGTFEHKGELYRMVKQRYAKDTLTIVCIRDTEHKKIDLALSDYVTTFTDKTADQKPISKFNITFLKDYLPISFALNTETEGWASVLVHNSHYKSIIPTFLSSITHPPERA